MKSLLSQYVQDFLADNPNPSPPLPTDARVLEELEFWPTDTPNVMYTKAGSANNLRGFFLRIQEKWPGILMEELDIGVDVYYVTDHIKESFLYVEKV